MLFFSSSLDDASIKANNSVVLWPKSKTLLLVQLGEAARLERGFAQKILFLSYKKTSEKQKSLFSFYISL